MRSGSALTLVLCSVASRLTTFDAHHHHAGRSDKNTMAKELFKPKYPPPGIRYAEARAANSLLQSETWWLRVRHGASVMCGCKTADGRLRRGIPHTFRESTKTSSYAAAKQQLETHKREL